jgi:hypothetical protein
MYKNDVAGVEIVTIPNPAASTAGPDVPCIGALVQQNSGTQTYMDVDTAATTSSWKLSATIPIPVPVSNLNHLTFIGTAGDLVQILYKI